MRFQRQWAAACCAAWATAVSALSAPVYQATGIKIGEVTQNSAVVWTRLSRVSEMRTDGPSFVVMKRREAEANPASAQLPPGMLLSEMAGAVPGAQGEVKISWQLADRFSPEKSTEWTKVDPAADFTAQIKLTELRAGASYRLRVESRSVAGEPGQSIDGQFRTPPPAEDDAPVRFIVTTCHDDWRRDDEKRGFRMYRAARAWKPDFFVHTGDFVYLDKAQPFALSPELARFKWNRTSAWESVREFYRGVSAYFIKDDHDVSRNDSAPGDHFGSLSFEQGVRLASEQLPLPHAPAFRSVRWGRHLEIWLLESREHRNARKGERVGTRTLLGAEQKHWLIDSVRRSTATFRLVVSGVPIVGPDVDYKGGDAGDSLADEVFAEEGREIRRALATFPNTFVVAGDRHWQYHSVDPATGLNEFGCGPACFGMAEEFVGKVKRTEMHRFLRIDGGFFSGEVARNSDGVVSLTLRHHDVDGHVVHSQAIPSLTHSTSDSHAK